MFLSFIWKYSFVFLMIHIISSLEPFTWLQNFAEANQIAPFTPVLQWFHSRSENRYFSEFPLFSETRHSTCSSPAKLLFFSNLLQNAFNSLQNIS